MKTVPAGVSKKTGRPYNSFLACPEQGCSWKPPREGGWQAVRQEVAEKVAPQKATMTREDWEAKEARTNKNILLQVAFKAAVELVCAGKANPTKETMSVFIQAETLFWHDWLLSHTEGQQTGQTPHSSPNFAPSGDIDEANRAINDALADEVGF